MARYEYHLPVMTTEIATSLVADEKGLYVDCTLGGGGHSSYLLERFENIKMIGLDCDDEAIKYASAKLEPFGKRMRIIRSNFRDVKTALASNKIGKVDGFFLDLGISSRHVDNKSRGFSFESPNLDMRMDDRSAVTAEELLNSAGQDRLSEIFSKYGEEWMADAIAARIVMERKAARITTGPQLCRIVAGVVRKHGKTNPATKAFQALRIAVNAELESLTLFLQSFPCLLKSSGRVCVLTYHSLEDRIVKQSFKELEKTGVLNLLNKKVIKPQYEEIRNNPRSRSAKLRCAELN